MKFVALLLAAVGAAIVTSMPTSNPDLQAIAATATQACPPERGDESELLSVFHDEMMEAINAINTTLRLNSQWVTPLGQSKDVYCNESTSNINITVVHAGLSYNQSTRLRALLQMSNYAHFLKSQNNTKVYENATAQLLGLWNKIDNIVFTIGELLPSVTCEDITSYTEEDVSGHVITAPQDTESNKRSFCYCVLEFMLSDSQSIMKTVGTNTMSA